MGLWRNWCLAPGYVLACAVKIQVAWKCWGFCAKVSVAGTEKRQKVDVCSGSLSDQLKESSPKMFSCV